MESLSSFTILIAFFPPSKSVHSSPSCRNRIWSSVKLLCPLTYELCQHVQLDLQKLCQHSLFLKLEKYEFHQSSVQFLGYNISAEGMQMDQGKVNAIQKWPLPNSVKELQRFLGFTNFYRRFIMDYSTITAPLTSLLCGKPKQLIWNPAAHEAFQRLKTIFSTAPVLHHPDPERPFTVEVDASTIGVGAVLSQAVGDSSDLDPCAAFSRKLTPAEQNYDIGNRELLAIQLALEEWRHWLEGVNHPFTPQEPTIPQRSSSSEPEASPLGPLPNTFQFYHHFSPDATSDPEPIIPSDLIVSPIIWDLDQAIQQATLQEPAPLECPEGKTYVPLSQRQTLLGTAHGAPGSGHPGSSRTLSLIQSRYWWPRKLVPLPILERPWSYLGVDFVTDLPESEGNTCVLVIVDRFSKACKLVPLRGLPTAMEMAEHLFHQTSGQTERKIQELGCYLRAYCQDDQHSWSRFLPWAEYAQNSLRQDTTGLTPFQCLSTTGFEKARECGTQLITIYSGQYKDVRASLMPGGELCPTTNLGICDYVCPAIS
ncbi:Transposon Tf2-9 polyprotein [Labeo rohita]|uniref:Gypsy retrotransposon integrase-like protein 1 n=1 Tax=Labeo rohita TaxID=84645 RepID=A0ABQ8L6K3_LABRO|nr:Transposon Tf2-9 polyprotein [Labeo rohita]